MGTYPEDDQACAVLAELDWGPDGPGDEMFCVTHGQPLGICRSEENASVVAYEARCTGCGEAFTPVGVTDEDLVHLVREDGRTECGGKGIIVGSWN